MATEVQHDSDSDSSNRLGPCEVCGATKSKYTCPRCEVKTCSLTCVNIHKKELECDGIRNKVFYKKLNKCTNLDLLSDYRLLEDVTRSVEKIQVNPKKHVSSFIPKPIFQVGKAARFRGMRFHFLPRNFKKAIENTSFYDRPSNIIHWRIEWDFPQANVSLVSKSVSETMRLAEALSIHLDPGFCKDENIKEKMQFYFSAGLSGIHALMRVGEMENNRYHILDLDSSLRSNLIRKSIVEFPVITIVLKHHVYAYNIYDSDDEVEQWKGNWGTVVSIQESQVDESPAKKKLKLDPEKKNFLVTSDDSSEGE